jgi:chromosome segregation ATPase
MLTEKEINTLRGENEYLLAEIAEVNELIKQKQQEIEALKIRAAKITEMQSRLDMNLLQFEQMQNNIGYKQQQAEGTAERMGEMEKELLAAIRLQNKTAAIVKEHTSLKANLLDTTNELDQAAALYKKVQQLKSSLTQSQSSLEISKIEIQGLKDELAEVKALNTMLLEKKKL